MIKRPNRDLYFLFIAHAVSLRSTCRSRHVGCVLVDQDYHILSTGYNGPSKGFPECDPCLREEAKSGDNLVDNCNAIHAEQNALLQCSDVRFIETAYITISPCLTCVKLLLNTKCQRIVFIDEYSHASARDMWIYAGREWSQYPVNAEIALTLSTMSNIREIMS